VLALPALGLALAFIGLLYFRRSASNLSLRVDGGELEAGGLLRALSGEKLLHFSDGSEVALSVAGQLHVRSLDERGARITLDAGHAHVYVVHTPKTHWEFAAGPFIVDVIGTAFGVSWDNATQELDLKLENGVVKVSGPMLDEHISLRAGQWLTVRQSEVRIRALGAPAEPDSAAALAPADSSAQSPSIVQPTGSAVPATEPSSAASDDAPRVSAAQRARAGRAQWSREFVEGQYEAIVNDALRTGLDTVLAESSAAELSVLADAARYRRHADVAESAFSALRRRFPSSSQAHTAAFLLGRLAEAGQDSRAALGWFGTYLAESPNGMYASEALGRKMTLVQRLDGDAAARPLAEAYLRRFATGTYAEAARSLAQ
jgi:TolA-binding protein